MRAPHRCVGQGKRETSTVKASLAWAWDGQKMSGTGYTCIFTDATAALMRSLGVHGSCNLETPCQRSLCSLSGFGALWGHPQPSSAETPSSYRPRLAGPVMRLVVSGPRPEYFIHCTCVGSVARWCRGHHPKGLLAGARQISAGSSSLFTIDAWSAAVAVDYCDLPHALYRRFNALPNPSVQC